MRSVYDVRVPTIYGNPYLSYVYYVRVMHERTEHLLYLPKYAMLVSGSAESFLLIFLFHILQRGKNERSNFTKTVLLRETTGARRKAGR